ncbi:hypothetical protein J0S82_020203 [Galemys pyrenaicus]|uniref:Uncharacterized protein n=1 Tax=Galemys pyrenaicus TaxID=202257 RepID=A0A8J6A374_GALPY|nr:hypothetical protein J0S82_020203 [Galemys pyrenaicus]
MIKSVSFYLDDEECSLVPHGLSSPVCWDISLHLSEIADGDEGRPHRGANYKRNNGHDKEYTSLHLKNKMDIIINQFLACVNLIANEVLNEGVEVLHTTLRQLRCFLQRLS